MSNDLGWIKLHRKILEWEWYPNAATRILFLHLLIEANWEDTWQNGILIKRGQLLTTVKKLATINQQTIQQTRTALERLKSTNEITIKTTSKFSIITVINYDLYQANNKPNNKQTEQQPNANQQTAHNKNNKPTILYKEERREESCLPSAESHESTTESGGWKSRRSF